MNIQTIIYGIFGSFLLFIGGLTVGALFYPVCLQEKKSDCVMRSFTANEHYTIALFQPVDQPALNEIMQGFQETLSKIGTVDYHYKRFNANGDKTLLRAQAEEIVQHGYDLIFTVGAACTQTVYELVTKKNIPVPIVFAAVDDPIGIGIIASLNNSGNQLTGVLEPHHFETQLAIIRYLKPMAKRVLLLYDPAQGTGLEKYKNEIENLAREKELAFKALQIHDPSQLQERVKSAITDADVILVLKDIGVLTARDALIKLCNAYGVTLFASDLNTGEQGAALAYGVKEYDFGVEGAYKAHTILEKRVQPADIPSMPVPCPKLLINKTVAHQQGLVLDAALQDVINNCQVIPCS